MKEKKKKFSLAGRPQTPEEDKKRPNGLTNTQWQRLQQEAKARGETAAGLLRRIVDWYFTALDTKQDSGQGAALFDDTLKEDGKSE